jgi:hypothetical protein
MNTKITARSFSVMQEVLRSRFSVSWDEIFAEK